MNVVRRILWGMSLASTLGWTVADAQEPSPRYDQVTLSARASAQVENDVLVAVLTAQAEAEQPAAAAESVNRDMTQAIAQARARPQVQAQTLQYHTSPVRDRQRVTGWRARQSLRLRSANAAVLSALVAELQASLLLESLDYDLTAQSRRGAEDGLIAEALAAFGRRAALIATQLGRPGYRIVHLNVSADGSPGRPVPRGVMRAMTAEAAVAPPALEPGVQRVQVSVSGTVELRLPD
jgi:predicted secreted protein